MSPHVCPPPNFELGPSVPDGPMPSLSQSPGLFEIAFPGLGAIKVQESSIVVQAESPDKAVQVWARYGAWARAQWWASKGHLVLSGAAVARAGKGVAIVGPSRVGCSVTALQLTRHGFGLVSDGFAVIAADGRLIEGPGEVSVDRQVREKLFGDYPSEQKSSGRDRVAVKGPFHGDAELASCIVLSVRDGITDVKTRRIENPFNLVKRFMAEPLLGAPNPYVGRTTIDPNTVDAWMVQRAAPESLEELKRSGPQSVATAIDRVICGRD